MAAKSPDPLRQAVGRENRKKWRGFTAAGLERLRQSALTRQAWRLSTGPRTVEGKARSANNGRRRQKGQRSSRQLRAEVTSIQELIRSLAAARMAAMDARPEK